MRRLSGFTLIEILIAMAIFLIGMVSILAVFPVGIKSSTISTDQSVATALAESLDDALTLSLRQYDGVCGSDVVWFYHDGLPNNGRDFFHLPAMETWTTGTVTYAANGHSRPTWYPFNTALAAPAWSHADNAWQTAPVALASLTGAKGGKVGTLVGPAGGLNTKDFADPLGQYSFRFMCQEYKNPNDSNAPLGGVGETTDECPLTSCSSDAASEQFRFQNGAQAEVVDKLYQFTVYIYRGWKQVQSDTTSFTVCKPGNPTPVGSDPYTWQDQMKHPKKIERFEFLIYAPGVRY